jgi:hypothetical protein
MQLSETVPSFIVVADEENSFVPADCVLRRRRRDGPVDLAAARKDDAVVGVHRLDPATPCRKPWRGSFGVQSSGGMRGTTSVKEGRRRWVRRRVEVAAAASAAAASRFDNMAESV